MSDQFTNVFSFKSIFESFVKEGFVHKQIILELSVLDLS